MRQLVCMINHTFYSHFPRGLPRRKGLILNAVMDFMVMTAMLVFAVLTTLILGV